MNGKNINFFYLKHNFGELISQLFISNSEINNILTLIYQSVIFLHHGFY
jgi:hypothetical protein